MSVKTYRRSIRSSVFEPRSCASRCQVRDESLNSRLCQAFFGPVSMAMVMLMLMVMVMAIRLEVERANFVQAQAEL